MKSVKPIKLTICICSLHERSKLLARLMECLNKQYRLDEIQIVINVDGGQQMTGIKRNALIQQALGDYIVFIDDDDLVADDYTTAILQAIDQNPGVDAIALRGVRTDLDGVEGPAVFDYRVMPERSAYESGVLWRSPGHLCPIRRDIVLSVPYRTQEPEDLVWSEAIADRITTCARAGKPDQVLYHYLWQSKKQTRWMKMVNHEPFMARWYIETSGPGSTVEFSEPYRHFVELFIEQYRIRSVLDLGCGDGVIASNIRWQGASYLGVDVLAERVKRNQELYPHLSFERSDLRSYSPTADLVLVKDVIQHWETREIIEWLNHFTRYRFKYALITNCNYGDTINTDCELAGWRAIDLTKPPFSVGEVVFSFGSPNKDVVLLRGLEAI